MKILTLLFVAVIAIQFLTFGQQEVKTNDGKKILLYEDGLWQYADSVPLYNIKTSILNKLEIPKTSQKDIIITHTGYSLLYNETHEQANWVAYELTKEETNKIFERTDKFIIDPLVKTKTANDKDYSDSGYDRGHLAPASDMGWSLIAMAEAFYYSNMSPQTASFNRGIWKRLETLVRTWAVENNSIYIVTGPVLTNGLPTIGSNKVSVPNYYYKVILDYREPSIKGIGFILSNTSSSEPLQNYAVTIDSVEKFTGIDFFPLLPDDQEELIEKTLCVKCWSWKSLKIDNSEKDEDKLATSVQCSGTTKKGNRCKNMTLNKSGYCYLHENQNSSSGNSPVIEQNKVVGKNVDKSTGSTNRGQTIYTGPRGGQYHYSKSGKKVYEKKK